MIYSIFLFLCSPFLLSYYYPIEVVNQHDCLYLVFHDKYLPRFLFTCTFSVVYLLSCLSIKHKLYIHSGHVESLLYPFLPGYQKKGRKNGATAQFYRFRCSCTIFCRAVGFLSSPRTIHREWCKLPILFLFRLPLASSVPTFQCRIVVEEETEAHAYQAEQEKGKNLS